MWSFGVVLESSCLKWSNLKFAFDVFQNKFKPDLAYSLELVRFHIYPTTVCSFETNFYYFQKCWNLTKVCEGKYWIFKKNSIFFNIQSSSIHWECVLEKCPNCRTVVKQLPPNQKLKKFSCKFVTKKTMQRSTYLCSSNKRNPFQKQNCFLCACNMDMVNNQPTPLGHISKHVQIVHHHEHSRHAYIFKMKTLQELMTNFILMNQIVGFIWFIISMKNKQIHENWVPTLWEWKHTIVQILVEHIIENSSFLHEEDIIQWQSFEKVDDFYMMRISIPDQLLHHSKQLNTQWCIIIIIIIIT